MDDLNTYLEFLELPPNTTQDIILQRINEKKRLFEQLLSNAPNDYLKNIHTRNLVKLTEIKTFINRGYIETSQEKQINTESKSAKIHQADSHDMPIPAQSSPKTAAWLIRHTENLPPKSFSLFDGKNFIGRISNRQQHEILIEDDIYVSRSHAFIEMKGNNYLIVDTGSKNGTYVNGQHQRISSIPLHDSDTIQLGNTKFVFRAESHKSIDDLVEEVDRSAYMKTIVIDIL